MSILPSASTTCFSYFRFVIAPATEKPMVKLALYARLEAKPGKEAALKAFLESALPLAQGEASTPVWFALQFGPSAFGIFDAFADEAGRQAHLDGPIAAALMSKADELLTVPITIEKVDLLAAKMPG
jgi:quinol monooxygenase YgiN